MRWALGAVLTVLTTATFATPVRAQNVERCAGLTGGERRSCIMEETNDRAPGAAVPQTAPPEQDRSELPPVRPSPEPAGPDEAEQRREMEQQQQARRRQEMEAEQRRQQQEDARRQQQEADHRRQQEEAGRRREEEASERRRAEEARLRAGEASRATVVAPPSLLPAVWAQPNIRFLEFNQLDANDSRLYSSAEWALAPETEERSARVNWTCLSTVYAIIEHARGNAGYRVGPDTYRDNAGGSVPIAGVRAGSDAPIGASSIQTIRSQLSQGNPVILRGFTPTLGQGHYVLAIGINGAGNIVAIDPYGGRQIEIEPSTWLSRGSRAGELRIQQYRLVDFAARSTPAPSRPTTAPPPAPPPTQPTPAPPPAPRRVTPTAPAVLTPAVPASQSPGSASSPGSTVGEVSVRLNWDSVAGAAEYDLGVRDMTTNQLVVDRRVNGSSYRADLAPGRTYRWNIRACNSAGCSAFTTPLYFRTPTAAPPPPTPPPPPPSRPTATVPAVPGDPSPGNSTGPGSTASSASVRLNWDSVAGADEYDLGIRDVVTNRLVVDRRVSGSSFRASLEPGRQYVWNVRACNAAGCSAFTERLYFRTPAR